MEDNTAKFFQGRVVSLHMGDVVDLSKPPVISLTALVDGFEGDRHRGPVRKTWEGEDQPAGTVRRNERQWSGVSVEELSVISTRLDLLESLSPEALGANLCVEGIPDFSLLPKGSRLLFPSGAELAVEEYNPPCSDMGEQIASKYPTRSGQPLTAQSWLRPASGRRGVVGVINVPGEIHVGDKVEVRVYQEPEIRQF